MDIPRTSSGKKCKLCTSKGSPCHLHSSVSPKRSSKTSKILPKRKTSPKRSPPSKIPYQVYLDTLPLPSLQQVLLNMDRRQLNQICSLNKRAKKICDLNNFKILYFAKNPPVIFNGALKEVSLLDTTIPRDMKALMFHDDDDQFLPEGVVEIEGLRIFRDTRRIFAGSVADENGNLKFLYYKGHRVLIRINVKKGVENGFLWIFTSLSGSQGLKEIRKTLRYFGAALENLELEKISMNVKLHPNGPSMASGYNLVRTSEVATNFIAFFANNILRGIANAK